MTEQPEDIEVPDVTDPRWTKLPKPPEKSGRYIVAHRGHAIVTHYLDPNYEHWAAGTKTGWQDPLDFCPTHWMELPNIAMGDNKIYYHYELADKNLKQALRREEDLRKKYNKVTRGSKLSQILRIIFNR